MCIMCDVMCECVCDVCMCDVSVCVFMCGGVSTRTLSILFVETGCLICLELGKQSRLASKPQGAACLCPPPAPGLQACDTTQLGLFLHGFQGYHAGPHILLTEPSPFGQILLLLGLSFSV